MQASRPPLPSFAFDWVKTSIELDVERQIVASILSLATWPARSKLAGIRFEQAELRAAEETLRLAAETRRAYIRAVAARQILTALNAAEASATSSASLSELLTQTGAVSKLDHAKRQVFATEIETQVTAARQQAAASEERLTRLLGLWGTNLASVLPNTLPPLPDHARGLGAIEQQAMERRVDLAVARLEAEALARSFGLTRKTHSSMCSTPVPSPRHKRTKASDRLTAAASTLPSRCPFTISAKRACARPSSAISKRSTTREKAVDARSEAREAFGAYKASYTIAAQYRRGAAAQKTISSETELQFNAMQVDAFALLEAARAKAEAQVASIEARRNFWLASTDLSVAVLGGGGLSDGRPIVSADASDN